MQEEAEQVEERMQSYNNQSVWERNDAGQIVYLAPGGSFTLLESHA